MKYCKAVMCKMENVNFFKKIVRPMKCFVLK
jgi:hypothetical protein